MRDVKYYVPGTLLIALATIILAVPQILIAFVCSFIIMAGIVGLCIGHLIRQSNVRLEFAVPWMRNNAPYGWQFVREPVYKRRQGLY